MKILGNLSMSNYYYVEIGPIGPPPELNDEDSQDNQVNFLLLRDNLMHMNLLKEI